MCMRACVHACVLSSERERCGECCNDQLKSQNYLLVRLIMTPLMMQACESRNRCVEYNSQSIGHTESQAVSQSVSQWVDMCII